MKNDKAVYVVTRDGRRIEEENYSTHAQANDRADSLRSLLCEWDPPSAKTVRVVKTDKPRRIR